MHDFKPGLDRFRAEVLSGLRKTPKELPSKYLYDEVGSYLYERICTLGEYYIPRTEAAIMEAHIEEIVELLGPNVFFIEYGCGNCTKTRVLLDYLPGVVAYVPIDISREQLLRVTKELTSHYPGLEMLPVCADYTSGFVLPTPTRPGNRAVVYFPGSTIGNFEPIPAKHFLGHIAEVCGPGGALLIGVDLKKDPGVLHNAYNDSQGVTATFNLNLLKRINRELNGNFQLEWFQHYAFYNTSEGRIDMHLVSLKEQVIHLDNVPIPFTKGESIWTESSYKFDLDEFEQMAATAGFKVEQVWTDKRQWFSVQYLVNTAGTTQ
ncbi:MAG: L-histidine N(alpha)-methyltransferase [Dehalococcoidales bacterium]|nr:L-histidine N(alpha)-methyltransferase [Dehalococcoidales bacterium]